jgi:hypothetical protein
MQQDQDVLESLMTGLTDRDRSGLTDAIRGAQAEQLDRKKHPPRRRHRDADGVLVDRPPGVDDESDAEEFEDEAGSAGGRVVEPSR